MTLLILPSFVCDGHDIFHTVPLLILPSFHIVVYSPSISSRTYLVFYADFTTDLSRRLVLTKDLHMTLVDEIDRLESRLPSDTQ